jgi:hypothetical protein
MSTPTPIDPPAGPSQPGAGHRQPLSLEDLRLLLKLGVR